MTTAIGSSKPQRIDEVACCLILGPDREVKANFQLCFKETAPAVLFEPNGFDQINGVSMRLVASRKEADNSQ